MAHFAEIDDDGIVQRVIVISNDDLLDENGIERESLGIAVCQNICGINTRWVQTSYNNTFRKKYAGLGDKYDKNADVFYSPHQPFASWTLNSNFDWEPPVPQPNDGKSYKWNEETLAWQELSA